MDSQGQILSFSVLKHENLRLQNNVHYQISRELGNRGNMNTSGVMAMKASQLHKTDQLDFCNYPILSVDFVKNDGDKPYIIAACNGQLIRGMLCFIELNFRRESSREHCPPLVAKLNITDQRGARHPIQDACFSKLENSQRDVVAYVTKSHYENRKSNIVFHVMGGNDAGLFYAVNSQVHSCAFSPVKERFVAGGERQLFFYESLRFLRALGYSVTPSALDFDSTGNVLFIGDNVVGLQVEDLRERQFRNQVRLYSVNRKVTQVKLLSDNITLIISGEEGLLKFDMRWIRNVVFDYPANRLREHVVLEYPGADVHCQKFPFSLSEKADILCSTGFNNETNLWSLSTGQPLCTIEPNCPSSIKSCIISKDNNWGVALLEKDGMHIFET